LQLLKYSRSPDLSDLLFGILDRIRASAIRHTLEEWFQACWNYAMTTNPYMTNTRIQEIVDELLSVEFEPGSAADQLYRQGHQEGLADGAEIGIIIGRIQLLQQLLGLEVSPSNELLQLDIPQINLIATSLEQRLNEK
jgi:predicted transposase YdaD